MTKTCDNCNSTKVFLIPKPIGVSRYECRSCGASVHCHPGTTEATGYMADASIRRLRAEAHEVFDKLWQGPSAKMSRSGAYGWLAKALRVKYDKAHISQLTEEQLNELIRKSRKMLKRGYLERENSYDATNRRKRSLTHRKRGTGFKDRRR